MSQVSGMSPVVFVGSSLSDLKALPDPVQDHFGYALYTAQCGAKHRDAKPLTGFGGSGVLEVVRAYRGGTFRAVYTVRLANAVYVLHVFQKKSKSGIETPQSDMQLVRQRLQEAERMAKERK